MDLLQVPKQLRDPEASPYLIRGPFAMTHNGIRGIGMWLEYREDSYVVYDGSRGWLLDDTYDVRVTGGTITFYSEQWDSKFVLRALTQDDIKWLAPDEPELFIDDLKEIIYRDISAPPLN